MKSRIETDLTRARRAAGPEWVVQKRGGQIVLYERPEIADPHTPDQEGFREAGRRAGALWRGLGAAEREAWRAWARRHGARGSRSGEAELTATALLQMSVTGRLLLGLEPRPEPPAAPYPWRAAVERVELLPESEDTRRFALRVFHRVAVGEEFRVSVALTPATVRAGRRPRTRDARLVRGFGPASTAALPPPGGVLTVEGARFGVEPGRRFGVLLRLVRVADGLAGPPLFADLVRV